MAISRSKRSCRPKRSSTLGLEGSVLSDLWKPADFMRARAWVKVANLKQPYRREVLENLRAVTQRDVAAIVECVRAGATFYVTPEGDFSRDGRMHPMRGGIVEALSPFAELWLCAVAYDPFRGRRLSMLYRVLRYDGAADIGTSLAGARPITTSALLAAFLLEGPETFAVAGCGAGSARAARFAARERLRRSRTAPRAGRCGRQRACDAAKTRYADRGRRTLPPYRTPNRCKVPARPRHDRIPTQHARRDAGVGPAVE